MRTPRWLSGEARNYRDVDFCKRLLSDEVRREAGMRTVAEDEAWAREYLRAKGKLHLFEPDQAGA